MFKINEKCAIIISVNSRTFVMNESLWGAPQAVIVIQNKPIQCEFFGCASVSDSKQDDSIMMMIEFHSENQEFDFRIASILGLSFPSCIVFLYAVSLMLRLVSCEFSRVF